MDEHCLETCVQAWRPLIARCDCLLRSTSEAMEAAKLGGALEHILDLLYGTSAKTSLPHAKGFSAFLEWLDLNHLASSIDSPEERLVALLHYLKHFDSVSRLNKKGVQSSNGVAKRTVLRRATTHIAFANDFLGILKPWPVHSPQIKMLVKSHFKKASKGLIQRVFFRYSPTEVLRLSKAAAEHT